MYVDPKPSVIVLDSIGNRYYPYKVLFILCPGDFPSLPVLETQQEIQVNLFKVNGIPTIWVSPLEAFPSPIAHTFWITTHQWQQRQQ